MKQNKNHTDAPQIGFYTTMGSSPCGSHPPTPRATTNRLPHRLRALVRHEEVEAVHPLHDNVRALVWKRDARLGEGRYVDHELCGRAEELDRRVDDPVRDDVLSAKARGASLRLMTKKLLIAFITIVEPSEARPRARTRRQILYVQDLPSSAARLRAGGRHERQ